MFNNIYLRNKYTETKKEITACTLLTLKYPFAIPDAAARVWWRFRGKGNTKSILSRRDFLHCSKRHK